MDLVEIQHLTKHYGPKQALFDVSFSINQGEVIGLLGPNGAGKTTTLRILAGFMPPSGGVVRVAGFDVLTKSLEARRHLGYLPENVPLYTEMPVRDFLRFIARARGLSGAQARRAINDAIEECRLEAVANTIIGRISRGYRQRVGLAQAILHSPDVLVLDEPTVGLDPRQITEIRNLIRELGSRRAILLSSHILPEVSLLCHRVVIINGGRVVAEDTPDALVTRVSGGQRWSLTIRGPRHEVQEALKAHPAVVSLEALELDGVTRFTADCGAEDAAEDLASLVVANGWGLRELRSAGMSLEDVFLQLTTQESDEPVEEEIPSPLMGEG
jgi:ABC-2 type transport system ATP-binding protein